MPGSLAAYLVATCLYAGFQWTVQLLVYRQFPRVPAAAFPAYERAHQRLVVRVVGPLFAALVLAAAAMVLQRPAAVPPWALATAVALLAVLFAVTWLRAVPQHRRLTRAWDARAYAALLRWDAVRTVVATAQAALAAGLALA